MILRFKIYKGFTLAEVLIALLIIGIVASLTIPGIIQNTQDMEFRVAYKKAFAVASNVTKQSIANSLFMARSGSIDQTATLYNFNVFKNQFSISKDCSNNNNDQCWNPDGEKACDGGCGGGGLPQNAEPAFVDNSGMAWSLYYLKQCLILVDTNGNKEPNRYGKDRWILTFHDNPNYLGYPYKIMPLYSTDVTSTDTLACHYPPCYYIKWLKE